jgi:hypothetical protein
MSACDVPFRHTYSIMVDGLKVLTVYFIMKVHFVVPRYSETDFALSDIRCFLILCIFIGPSQKAIRTVLNFN